MIELTNSLVREIEIRAVHEGREMTDMVVELLRNALLSPEESTSRSRQIDPGEERHSELPLIQCKHPAKSNERLTPDRIADILLEQEVTWQDETRRH